MSNDLRLILGGTFPLCLQLVSVEGTQREQKKRTFFFHASPKTFVEPAESTLVPLVFVHNALPAEPGHNRHTMTRTCYILNRKVSGRLR